MAQEISVTVNSNITLQGQTVSGNTAFKADLTGDYVGEEQDIWTNAEALDFGAIIIPTTVYIRNLDATNYVQVDSASAMTSFPQKIMPGQAIMLLPQTGTIYAKANTAACKIFLVAG